MNWYFLASDKCLATLMDLRGLMDDNCVFDFFNHLFNGP